MSVPSEARDDFRARNEGVVAEAARLVAIENEKRHVAPTDTRFEGLLRDAEDIATRLPVLAAAQTRLGHDLAAAGDSVPLGPEEDQRS